MSQKNVRNKMKKETKLNLSGTKAKSKVRIGSINRMTELISLSKEKAQAQGKKTSSKGEVPKNVGVKGDHGKVSER